MHTCTIHPGHTFRSDLDLLRDEALAVANVVEADEKAVQVQRADALWAGLCRAAAFSKQTGRFEP